MKRAIKLMLLLLVLIASLSTLEKVSYAEDKYVKVTLDESFDGGKRTIFELKENTDVKSKFYMPKRKGYKFRFWSISEKNSSEVYSLDKFSYYPAKNDQTIYAKWIKDNDVEREEKYFKLTLDENYDGARVTTQEVAENFYFNNKLYTPAFKGCKFKEWNTKADGTGYRYDKQYISRMTKDITLYAIWDGTAPKKEANAKYYKVTITENFKEGRKIQCLVKEGTNLVYDPSQGRYDSYYFLGMYEDVDGEHKELTNLAYRGYEYKINSDVKLIAAFNKYEELLPDPEPERPAFQYRELRLHYEDGTNKTERFFINPNAIISYKEIFKKLVVKPKKNPDDLIGFVLGKNGKAIAPDKMQVSESYVNKENSDKKSIDVYMKWKSSEDSTTEYCKLILDYNNSDNENNRDKIELFLPKGSNISDLVKDYKPSLPGLEFNGWSMNSSDGKALDKDAIITGETTLVASWSRVTTGGSLPEGYGTTITLNENYLHATITEWYRLELNVPLKPYLHTPVREGYKFLGWNSDSYAKGKTYTEADILERSLYLYAIWEEEAEPEPVPPIILTLDENYKGGKITDKEVMHGDMIEPHLYKPKRRGHTFKGWSYNKKHLDRVHGDDIINEPTTIYAIWDEVEEEPEEIKGQEHKAYIFGYPDGTVRPNGEITRAEAAAMLARLLEIESIGSADKPSFPDTPSVWYNKAINAVVQRDIMKGYPDGTFKPNSPITRAEFTQMIWAIDNKPYGTAPFADVVGHWAERPIGSEYEARRIAGYPDGTFRPDNSITRCEAAVILNKIFERNFDAMSLLKCKNPMMIKYFTDLDMNFWGYYDMVEATNSHDFVRRVKGRVPEDWLLIK